MNIVPFESAKVPSTITTMFGDSAKDLIGSNSGGFPVISIKGKVFHIQRGGDRTLITKPGEDDPAASIEVVIVKANPNNSKVFYAAGYVEGSQDKPTCYSNNGISPEADATQPQASKCAACPHNQWGSKITDGGAKAKACADSRRIAVATLDAPGDPMLVRVPAASLKSLAEFGKTLAARGLPSQAVVTKIGFDYSVAWPALTFKPVGLIGDAPLLREIKAVAEGELAAQIVGMQPSAAEGAAPEPTPAPEAAPAPAPKAAAPAPKAAPAAAPAADAVENAVAAAATTKKVNVKVGASPATPTGASLEDEIAGMLDGMDFDN